jgi:glycosyltransferase involved in cell wall biosynthesis
VVVRSYNRLPALVELIDALRAQDHDAFEVVIVEQSTVRPPAAVARLAAHEDDRRMRVLRSGPLGGARARNVGVGAARGDIVVFVDDDDLPMGRDFLRRIEGRFDADPGCLGLTVRHFWRAGDVPGRIFRRRARRRCMRFSPLLRLPYTYARHDQPVARVDYVHGTGGAFRREVFVRFGGWDEDTPIEDEASLGIRIGRGLAAGEHLSFFPDAHLLRRLDLDGGLAKRTAGAAGYYRRFMTFVHHILGRYHRTRVQALYPLYVLAGWWWTLEWIWADSNQHRTTARRIAGTVGFTVALPFHAARALMGASLGRGPGSGMALAVTMAAASDV